MQISSKHVFVQNAPSLDYMALGDTSVRIIAILSIIQKYNMDYYIVVPKNKTLLPLWKLVFKDRCILSEADIPLSHVDAVIHKPTSVDWGNGSAAHNVFESIYWENGFFDNDIVIPCFSMIKSNHDLKAVMIYPKENTDRNRVFDSSYWIKTCGRFRANGYKLNHLGNKNSPVLKELYDTVTFDKEFPENMEGLVNCIQESSVSIGSSTGPTWACLLSDIYQIVLQMKITSHGYWLFERNQKVLHKKLHIIPDVGLFLPEPSI